MRWRWPPPLEPSTRVGLVVAVAAAALVALCAQALHVLNRRVIEEREARIQATVRTAWAAVDRLGALERAGRLGRAEAQEAALAALRGLRRGDEYFWVSDVDARMLMHPARPDLEGRDLTAWRDEDGTALFVRFADAARSAGEGFVTYRWPRPEGGPGVRKLAFVKLYAPWGWVVGSGSYLDDLDAMLARTARRVLAAAGLVALVLLGAGIALARTVRRMEALETARGDAEARVRRHARALRALSSCNEALVRASDEQELLEAVCRIVVEDGGYRFAWVGWAEEDADGTRRVRPATRAGFEDGYLETADVRWDGGPRSRGPVGTAVRTGTPTLVRDAASDAAFAPWKEDALRRGYRSVLALPLACEGKVLGALTIYAAEPGRFDDADERRLLLDLADDLAYGVSALRGRAERARMTSQLMRADRLATMGTLAAGVAHEINNPLAYVLGGVEHLEAVAASLAAEVPPGRLDEGREVLAEVRHGCERIRDAVRELKQASRGDEESREPVELERVLEFSIGMAQNEIRHRARLVRERGPTPPVEANASRLGQVFLNLLVNAAHAIPEGAADRHEIRVATRTDAAGRAVVEVRDTGVGIPRQHQARIFEPFFTTKPVGVGTGLGLAICRDVVGALGGAIEVESTPGAGSLFRVTLPPWRAPSAAPAPAAAAPHGDGAGRRRVLAVDDEPLVVNALRRALGAEWELVHAATADAGLAHLEKERVDAVLCDLMMPEKSGIEFYEELRARDPAVARRVVFLTGGGFTPAAQAFLESTENPVLEKPFDREALRAALERLAA
jgi:signal transduction histidine kinase